MKKSLSVENIVKIIRPGDIDVSLDGKIAFTFTKPDIDANKNFSELWIRFSDGKIVFYQGEGDSMPRWSPTGDYIAFSSRRGAKEDEKGSGLFLLSPGGEPRKVKWFEKGIGGIEWLNDKEVIVKSSLPVEELSDKDEDYVMTNKLPLWYDGRGFVGNLTDVLMTIDIFSGRSRELVREERITSFTTCNKHIYYSRILSWDKPNLHVLVRLSFDGEKKELVKGVHISQVECINNQIYVLANNQKIGIASHDRLYKLSEDSSLQCITCDFEPNIWFIVGEYKEKPVIGYAWKGAVIVGVVDEKGVRNITGIEEYIHTAHAKKDIIAYWKSSPIRPPEFYVMTGEKEEKLTSLNEWLVNERMLYKPTKHTIKSVDEEVDYWVIDPEPSKKKPVILFIHGGPKGMYGYYFHPEIQLYANNGFLVVYSNPRGSDGYNEEFADIRGKYGVTDYQQIMDSLEDALKRHNGDEEKMAVTGISYGGYMTNVIITKTSKFKAAVPENGIGDWIADFWASDIGFWFDKDQIGETPWSNLKEYLEKSPAFNAEKVSTPTLIIHSMQDYRCFVDQALSMHVALKMNGKESTLLLFNKGSHGFSVYGEPRIRVKRLKIKLSWIKEKLGVK